MIIKIPAASRYHADYGWLKTFLLFSFANYQDPANMHFGTLRVFNDDRIDAHTGFSEHDHDNMEIVTIVLEGELSHRDSLGNKGTIKAGEVQHMSAGTGITHAEMNDSGQPVHLCQIWIFPKSLGLASRYGQKDFTNLEKNILVPVAADESSDYAKAALPMQTDAVIFLAEMEAGKNIEHKPAEARGAFVYVSEGALNINGQPFAGGDQARIRQEEKIVITASEPAKFILIDVPLIDGE